MERVFKMAMYNVRAEKLKGLVETANFSKQQLNVVLKMMEGCSQLRQGSVIRSFFTCMLPEKYELKEDSNNPVTYTRNGTEKTFSPSIVLDAGEEIPEAKNEEVKKITEDGFI